jgi:hypothetical protein
MNNYEEIKNLLEASRNLLGGSKMIEEQKSIKKRYGLITEQGEDNTETIDAPDNTIDRSNPMKDIESKIKYDTAEDGEEGEEVDKIKSDKKKGYRISGGILYIHGKDNKDLQLTTDDKIAFQESMDEFVSEVAEIVDFNKLNLYPNNVEWSGKITEYDIEFFFSIGESNGVYVNGDMMKVDEEFLTMMNKLQTYYEKFKSKWSKVIASRKKTKE